MGRRYTAVMKEIGVDPLLVDIDDPVPSDFDGVIIATPTRRHVGHIEQFLKFDVPILCEKPFATSSKESRYICNAANKAGVELTMVNQYAYLEGGAMTEFQSLTSYNYFNHGRDGIAWDCISVVALARGAISLGEDSPIWSCVINGVEQRLSDMDHAYIRMVKAWLAGDHVAFGQDYIIAAHEKVEHYLEAGKL
jgi:hypothetical protein